MSAIRWALTCVGLVGLLACGRADIVESIPLDVAPEAAQPSLSVTREGGALLSYLEPEGDGLALRFRVLEGVTWSDARTVVARDDLLANWADFPTVVPSDDLWVAHWLVRSPGPGFAYDAWYVTSDTEGLGWSSPARLHTDRSITEHGFVSFAPSGDRMLAIWLDGRAFSKGTRAMQLMSRTLGGDGSMSAETALDERVCECCQTALAQTAAGHVAVYRNRSEEEVRDIYATTHVAGVWSDGAPVASDGWVMRGCPVNGPAVAASGDDVAVTWFTAHPRPRVQAAFSHDGGASFDAPVDVDLEAPIGRVAIAWLDADSVAVAWVGQSEGQLRVRRVRRDGSVGETLEVAEVGTERRSGFPQMVRAADHLIFAWTATDALANPSAGVVTARLPWDEL